MRSYVIMTCLDTSAGRLFYTVSGDCPPILLWHSWLGNHTIWQRQITSLSQRHTVIAVDGPCHGRSEVRPFTLDDCADAVLEILDAEGISTALLGGLSWGGMTVMRAALRSPGRVKGLALFATSAESEPLHNLLACRFFAETVQRVGFVRPMLGPALGIMFGKTTLRERRAIVRDEIRRLRTLDCRGISWSTQAIVSDRRPILDQLKSLWVPTMVVAGQEDRCLPPPRSRRIARTIPGANLHVLPKVGHLIPVEAPSEATRLILQFADNLFRERDASAA